MLENAKMEIQMLNEVNHSMKEFLISSLKSEENLAMLNSHFNHITHILTKSEGLSDDGMGSRGEATQTTIKNDDTKAEILAKILNLELEIDKIRKTNEQKINQSNINEVIDQMNELNVKVIYKYKCINYTV